ncbi:MFS transporter, partial [Acidocella aminolytica]
MTDMARPAGERISGTAWGIAAVASLSGLLIGYNTAVIAPALPFISGHFGLLTGAEGAVVATVLIGGFAGSFIAGSATRRWGQKPVLIAAALLFAVGAVGSAAAESVLLLSLWRLALGLAVGASSAVAPLY